MTETQPNDKEWELYCVPELYHSTHELSVLQVPQRLLCDYLICQEHRVPGLFFPWSQ